MRDRVSVGQCESSFYCARSLASGLCFPLLSRKTRAYSGLKILSHRVCINNECHCYHRRRRCNPLPDDITPIVASAFFMYTNPSNKIHFLVKEHRPSGVREMGGGRFTQYN